MFKVLKSKKMIKNETSCIRFSDSKFCPSCESNDIIKNGFTINKKQQFICKSCPRYRANPFAWFLIKTRPLGYVQRSLAQICNLCPQSKKIGLVN